LVGWNVLIGTSASASPAQAPEQQRGWFRDPHDIPREAFPVTVEIEYVVHYGRRGHKMRRKSWTAVSW
jgi:hypothetical protein